jgi:hypothetical protein
VQEFTSLFELRVRAYHVEIGVGAANEVVSDVAF